MSKLRIKSGNGSSKVRREARPSLYYLALVCMVGVLGITILLWSSSSSSLEGAVIYDNELIVQPVKDFQPSCLDSDPQQRYEVKGNVRIGRLKYNDYCRRNTKKVIQFYCAGNRARATKSYDCLNGCRDGECII